MKSTSLLSLQEKRESVIRVPAYCSDPAHPHFRLKCAPKEGEIENVQKSLIALK